LRDLVRRLATHLAIALLAVTIAGPIDLLSAPPARAADAVPTESPDPAASATPDPTPEPGAEETAPPTPPPDPAPTPTPEASESPTAAPDASAQPTSTLDPTPSPEPTPSPDPTPSPTPTPPPFGSFTSPAAGPELAGVAGPVTVRWMESVPVTNRVLSQYFAPARAESCTGVTWTRAWSRSVATTSATVRSHVRGICYRYALAATVIGGGPAPAVQSGVVRVAGRWSGIFDVYRSSAFSTQLRWYWCVPASIQAMLNIIKGTSDHSWSNQYRYYKYGRPRRARLFSSLGLDPQSWMLTLNRYGGDGYRVVTSTNLASLIKYAARRNRLTGKPVGLLVARGGHAWVMTGFKSTADPAVTSNYRVTAIRTMGPLWPRQRYRNGYFDSPPGKYFSMATVPYFYGRYRDRLGRTPWDGRYVIISP
jgi:hypothetical protein